jgi:LacI family transcriptional regulator
MEIKSFFDPLRAGVKSAADAMLGATVDLDFRSYPRLGEGDAELLEADAMRHFNGIVATPGDPAIIGLLLQRFVDRGIAVVCVVSDAPRSKRLSAISVDATVSGGIAAELLAMNLQRPSSVATITGDLHFLEHAEKLRGFAATLATIAPHLALLPAIEGHERQKDSYKATLTLLEEHHLLGKIQIVTTDLFPELIPLIEAGKILATIYQQPFTQGKIALETLMWFLTNKIKPAPVIKLAPQVVLRSNLSLFANHLPGPDETEISASAPAHCQPDAIP